MEFEGLSTYPEVEAKKELIRMNNNYLLNSDKYELLANGDISFVQFGTLCRNLALFYGLPNTEKKTVKMGRKAKPGSFVKNINIHILKIGLKKAVLEGYISIYALKDYYDGYRAFKEKKLDKINKKKEDEEEQEDLPFICEDFTFSPFDIINPNF